MKFKDSRQHTPGEEQAAANYQCDKCGVKHYGKQSPAYGKQCHKCGKYSNLAKLCRDKKTVQVLSL